MEQIIFRVVIITINILKSEVVPLVINPMIEEMRDEFVEQ